ncbi:uncharacterized protein LOC132607761 [Lycium barbarum]|uniref:uncharacterized protein LOC132607761 n=1 Tax=Lycium barbarum TaxID=112863 RepID=UPI00293F25D5|nr:uncharacterized protein LOC132607761 [Lycium barbarum]
MKVWERVIEMRMMRDVSISENHFRFMLGRSTTETYLIRRMVEQYKDKRETYTWCSLIWRWHMTESLERSKGVHVSYIKEIDLEDAKTREEWSWCMLFADDIVLINETLSGVKDKMDVWRTTLESTGFRLSRTKTEYMECKFSDVTQETDVEVKIEAQTIPKRGSFNYLGSIIQGDGEIDNDAAHRISAGWMKWRRPSGVLCNKKVSPRRKGIKQSEDEEIWSKIGRKVLKNKRQNNKYEANLQETFACDSTFAFRPNLLKGYALEGRAVDDRLVKFEHWFEACGL